VLSGFRINIFLTLSMMGWMNDFLTRQGCGGL